MKTKYCPPFKYKQEGPKRDPYSGAVVDKNGEYICGGQAYEGFIEPEEGELIAKALNYYFKAQAFVRHLKKSKRLTKDLI